MLDSFLDDPVAKASWKIFAEKAPHFWTQIPVGLLS